MAIAQIWSNYWFGYGKQKFWLVEGDAKCQQGGQKEEMLLIWAKKGLNRLFGGHKYTLMAS